MTLEFVTRILGFIGIAVAAVGLLLRMREILGRPIKPDLSRPRGSGAKGVLYAFTLGMAPWEKESTRLHWISYLRGIFFHVGIFTAYGVFFIVPALDRIIIPVIWALVALTGLGAIFGFAGIYLRLAGPNERALSLPDDYFAVFLASLFTLMACISLISAVFVPAFYVVTALLSAYVPFGKIRHCAYFFVSKFFFGQGFGHRGVLGPGNRKAIR